MSFSVEAGFSVRAGEWLKTVPRPATSTRTDNALAPLVAKIPLSCLASDGTDAKADVDPVKTSPDEQATATTAVRDVRNMLGPSGQVTFNQPETGGIVVAPCRTPGREHPNQRHPPMH